MSSAKVIILQVRLRLLESGDDEFYADFNSQTDLFEITDSSISCKCLFETKEFLSFINKVEALQKYLKGKQNRMLGDIFVIHIDGEVKETGKIKLYSQRTLTFEACELKISLKSKKQEKEEKEILSEEDKVSLFTKFVKEKKREPEKRDIIDGFRIGAYYQRLKINGEHFKTIENIMNELI
jgi:hypothetical protein